MVASAANNPTLSDVAKGLDPDGSVAIVAEILNETNEILDDMTFMEGNLTTGHRSVVRTGLPEPTWRQMYGGVQPTKANKAQIQDTTGMLEAYAEVDKKLADLGGNAAAFREGEARAHIEGMGQSMAETLFLGNEIVNPERFTGFNQRFNDTSADNGINIIDGGGVGADNASIWLVGWGSNSVFGIYPKGSQAGLQSQDLGEVTIENVDGNNGRMQGYRSHFTWDNGLVVKDWRYVVRIANIDRSLLTKDITTGADLPDLMFEATERTEKLSTARFAWYMDRTILTMLRKQSAVATTNSTLMIDDVGGVKIKTFESIPIRRVDELAVDEAQVT